MITLVVERYLDMQEQAAVSYHHGNLRQELLECAERHLISNGISKLSLRALAREIGVSQTAPYRHFEDKDALLAALATDGFHRLFDRVSDELAGRTLHSALRDLGMAYLDFAIQHTEIFRLMFGPGLQPRNKYPELFAAGREAIMKVNRLIESSHKDQDQPLSRDEALSLSHTAWAGVHGVATLMLDHSDTFGYHKDLRLQAEKSLHRMLIVFGQNQQ